MNNETILLLEKHFDVAFAAPDGIKKLRELILSLAMQGKLVPQDPSDQSASELLKEIELEKQKLIKEGKIKQSKPLPEIKPDEVPYDLPKSWEWVRLGDLGETQTGATPSTKDVENFGTFIPFINPGNIKNYIIDYSDQGLSEVGVFKGRLIQKHSILMVCIGGSIGKHAINDRDITCNQQINIITPYYHATRYIFFAMGDKNFQTLVIEQSSGSATPIINKQKWSSILLPLPPLAEQRRIVSKIDELMARCDELEKLQGDRTQKQITVHTAALNRLLTAKDSSDFNTAWNFITQHFSELYSVKSNVAELRKAILQLAVMGKLVPQDPNDQPASELLKAIASEKNRLMKEGKIKKPKSLPVIEDKEISFDLPDSWQWVRLGDITSKITDGDHQTPPRISEGYRLLSAKNVRNGYLDFDNCDFISEENYLKSRERCYPEFKDLLIVSVGGTIGRTSLIPEDSFFALVRSVALIKPLLIDSSYLKYSMDSSLLQNSIHARKRGGAQPCLYLSEIELFPFSLPPLAEQDRIVTKIHQLMTLCDELEKQIDTANSKQTNLLNAVMTKI